MAKASLATRDSVETSLGIQEGNVEFVAACCKVHQFPPNKKTGSQSDPFCCAAIQLQKLDKEMESDGSDPSWTYLTFGKDSLVKFHPGDAQSADDDDPSDLGEEVDTEGNTVFLVDEGAKLNKKCKWMMFASSLEQMGFKPDILGKGFFPDLIGTKAHVKTIKMERISDEGEPPTCLVVDKIFVYPYAKKAGKAAAGAAAGTGAAGKKAPDKKAKPEASSSDNGDLSESHEKAMEIMGDLSAEQSGVEIPLKKLHALAQTKMIRGKVPGKLQKEVLALTDSEDWLGENGFEVEDGVIKFA